MKSLLLSVLVVIGTMCYAQTAADGWNVFARVKFNSQYFKELKEYFLVPAFDATTKAKEGTSVTLKGYYLPMDLEDVKTIIISKKPYAECFFCGGAGPESVAEISFSSKPPRLKADQVITVRGKLKLNDTNVNHLNFILTNAEIVTK